MSDKSKLVLKATPEVEDFHGKYTNEGSGKLGSKLLDGYFAGVESLVKESGVKTGKAIELGCGAGFSTQRIRDFLPAKVDLMASEFVDHLIPDAKKMNPKIKVIQESVYELTHKDNTFDLVFLLEVMEHLDYPDKALEEIKRVIKPGGYLIIGVPREPLWRGLNMARGKYLKDFGNTIGHLNHWSTSGLVAFAEKNFGTVVAKRTPLPWSQVLVRKDD